MEKSSDLERSGLVGGGGSRARRQRHRPWFQWEGADGGWLPAEKKAGEAGEGLTEGSRYLRADGWNRGCSQAGTGGLDQFPNDPLGDPPVTPKHLLPGPFSPHVLPRSGQF